VHAWARLQLRCIPPVQKNGPPALTQRLIWTLAILACLAAVARIGFDVNRRAGGMRTVTATAASILAAAPGARIKTMVRIERATGPNSYAAEVLESRDGVNYHPTPTHIRVVLGGDTAVVMGGVADIAPGAVIQLSGKTDDAHTLHAKKVVILSGYVRIVPVQG
jgi:hypothetical protein